MIHVSEQWRYVAPMSDKGHYEDALVQHTTVEHRAVRRVFSDKICADEVALTEIIEQVRLAADCNPPILPRIYQVEVVQEHTSILWELVEGRSLEDVISLGELSKFPEWTDFALRFINELIDLQRAGGRFERMDPSQLVILETGDVRLKDRSPIGNPSQESIKESPLLQRLSMQIRNGVYTSSAPPQVSRELDIIKTILFQMAAGSCRETFDQFLANQAKRSYGPDGVISDFLLSIHNGGLANLDAIKTALKDMISGQAEKVQRDFAEAKNAAKSANIGSGRYNPQTLTSAPAASKTPSGSPADLNPYLPSAVPASGQGAPPAAIPASANMRPVAAASVDDANPYGPTAPIPGSTSGGPMAVPPSAPVHMMVDDAKEKAQSRKSGMLMAVVAVVVIAVLLGAGITIFRIATHKPEADERPLVRSSTPLETTAGVNGKVRFDASDSLDPEGKPLTYNWEIKSPEDAIVIFTEKDSSKGTKRKLFSTTAPIIDAQFISSGEIVLTLRVNDGVLYSDTLEFKVNVQTQQKP